MARDYHKLEVFDLADGLAVEMYRHTQAFPLDERFGLISQLRRAAVSVPTNIVEGSTRPSERDYLHFLSISLGSATEAYYLLGLSARLGYGTSESPLELGYLSLTKKLHHLIDAIKALSPKP